MRKMYYVMPLVLSLAMLAGCNRAAPSPSPTGTTPTTTTQPNVSPSPAAPGSPAATGSPAPAAGGTSAAQTVYKSNCMSCHGANLEGGVGPNLKKVGSKLSADDIAGRIANGKGAMPPFKGSLSDSDIHALADWLATQK